MVSAMAAGAIGIARLSADRSVTGRIVGELNKDQACEDSFPGSKLFTLKDPTQFECLLDGNYHAADPKRMDLQCESIESGAKARRVRENGVTDWRCARERWPQTSSPRRRGR